MAKEEAEEETMFSPRLSSASSASSHEFSFWPSSSSLSVPTSIPDFSSADDIFSNGILLPTVSSSPHTLPASESKPEPEIVKEVLVPVHNDIVPETELDPPLPNPASIAAAASSSSSTPSSSKRWKEIFKLGDKEKPVRTEETKKKSKKDKKPGNGNAPTSSVSSADISINIWPFGRSRSAGTASSSRKPTTVPSVRKSSSAPCSRSNSRGESGKAGSVGRRWAASPGRTGVHVGRSSPVWQIKRSGGSTMMNKATEPVKVGSGSARVINFSVNSCIGYGMRDHGRCGGESKDGVTVTGSERHGGLFGIKGLFAKKPVH